VSDYPREFSEQDYRCIWDLKHKLKIAVEALEKIAGMDYRGNRSMEMTMAFNALKEMRCWYCFAVLPCECACETNDERKDEGATRKGGEA